MPKLPSLIEHLPSRLQSVDVGMPVTGADLRPAGVLVLLFPRDADIRFFLTARPETLTHHAGQISLPGGRMEVRDLNLWETACRETREELGVRTGRLVPLGSLDAIPVSVSNYLVWPFVAWSPVVPRIDPDPNEVAAAVEVSLTSLLDQRVARHEEWGLQGVMRSVTVYRFGDVIVWGVTARVLGDLAARLGRIPKR
jgi:8-oxo-dGTP pyrophosphatase MutT (NUDIX family)